MVKCLIGLLMCVVTIPTAMAQEAWPARTVSLVVGSSPGGATDTFARIIAQRLTETLKQTFVVRNQPGGSGNIGASFVAKSPADGYTLLVASNQALVITPELYKNLSYSAEKDFVPVARGVISPLVFVASASMPAKSLADLVALGKQQPGKITYGSAGIGSTTYLGVRMLEELSGARFLHIPYSGVAQALQGLLSHVIDFQYVDIGTALPSIQAGSIRALAVTQHIRKLPDVPRLSDLGYPDLEETFGTFSVVAPTGTAPAIVQRLNAEINDAMRAPEVASRFNAQVLIPAFDTPEMFAASLKRERAKWGNFIRRNGIAIN
jgi:tripartite-type tricarboxylate transporter receptor subunit TctC